MNRSAYLVRFAARCLAWSTALGIESAGAMDYLAFWTDESEAIVIGRVAKITTLPIREEIRRRDDPRKWDDFRPGTVAEVEVSKTLKGEPVEKVYCWAEGSWGGPPLAVDDQPALMFLDSYNGLHKKEFQYLASDGTARPLLNVSAGDGRGRMPVVRIGGVDYVKAWHEEHLPSYVRPTNRAAKLSTVVTAIQRRIRLEEEGQRRRQN
ncbi:MAG: hypothetical protein IPK07_21455 [Deltaproteobacteria bacterium]|nr:hypothetical protein [Deltaproteobacteria bacterium]